MRRGRERIVDVVVVVVVVVPVPVHGLKSSCRLLLELIPGGWLECGGVVVVVEVPTAKCPVRRYSSSTADQSSVGDLLGAYIVYVYIY